MTMRAIVLGLVGLAAVVNAQVPFLGGCPSVKTMQDFNVTRYLGKWYEIEKYFAVFELGGKCITAQYDKPANANDLTVTNRQINTLTGATSSIDGTISQTSVPSELTVKFNTVPVPSPYWVLDTDYDNYSVVWACNNFGLFSTRFSWILSRMPNPSLDVLERAYKVIDNNNITRAFFMRTDQKNCPENH